MPIISISRGSYSQGKYIAEKLAENLGYECVSREILLRVADILHVPESKIENAVAEAPSLMDRFSKQKDLYVRTIKAALLSYVKKDNVVYHGVFGAMLLKDVGHALKVRIQVNIEARIAYLMSQEGLNEQNAREELERRDMNLAKWGKYLYNIDCQHPSLYDLIVNVGTMTIDDAIDLIQQTAKLNGFQSTPQSIAKLNDLALEAEIYAALIDVPATTVSAAEGNVSIQIKAPLNQKEKYNTEVRHLTRKIDGIESLDIVLL